MPNAINPIYAYRPVPIESFFFNCDCGLCTNQLLNVYCNAGLIQFERRPMSPFELLRLRNFIIAGLHDRLQLVPTDEDIDWEDDSDDPDEDSEEEYSDDDDDDNNDENLIDPEHIVEERVIDQFWSSDQNRSVPRLIFNAQNMNLI